MTTVATDRHGQHNPSMSIQIKTTLETSNRCALYFPVRQPVPNMSHRWKQRQTLCFTPAVPIPSVSTLVFSNLCVKMPLGQNQSHTLRLTLALSIPSVKTVLFEHLTFQETKQRCVHVLSVITSHVTCLCLYPARAVVGHDDIGWRRCCDCNGSACCWRWHHNGVPC